MRITKANLYRLNRIIALDAVPASPILDGKPGAEFVLISNQPFMVGALEYGTFENFRGINVRVVF